MAVYIDDSGAFGYDALISGVENTDWSRDTTNQILWMKTSSGSSDTGFILPMTSSWLLIEVYDVGTTGDGAGVSGQLGRTEWKSGITDATQTALNAFRTALPTSYAYYKIKATEYSGTAGTDAVDVWEADNTTAFGATADYTVDFTPSTSSWEITDTLIAPADSVYLFELASPFIGPDSPSPIATGYTVQASGDWTFHVNLTTGDTVTATESNGGENGTDSRFNIGIYNSFVSVAFGNRYSISDYSASANTTYDIHMIRESGHLYFYVGGVEQVHWTTSLLSNPSSEAYIGARNLDGVRDRLVTECTINTATIRAGAYHP